jgi:hypothetical protein
MRDDIDIEALLEKYPIRPGSGVKRSVMAFFRDAHAQGPATERRWRFRPSAVPAAAAAAILITTAVLSFFIGWRMPRAGGNGGDGIAGPRQARITELQQLEWVPAEKDVL